MRTFIAILAAVVVILIAVWAIDVDFVGETTLPAVDVDTADVDIGTRERSISVPDVDVDVDMKEKTIETPEVRITPPHADAREDDAAPAPAPAPAMAPAN
jgi:hypothetical protein